MLGTRAAVAALMIAIVAGATGCASLGDDPVGDPSPPSVTPSASLSPSVEPSPEPSVPEPVVLTSEGLGYIHIGAPVPETFDGPQILEWDENHCEGYSGAWVPVDDSSGITVDETSDLTRAGAIRAIVVSRTGYATDTGISVGSTVDEVVAAYPSATVIREYEQWRLFEVTGATGRLQLSTDAGFVNSMAAVAISLGENATIGPTDWYGPCS